MSHIATIKTAITDLEAVRKACAELGLVFKENQKTCRFYPSHGNPQIQPCDHAIELPYGDSYRMDLGLVRTATGYDLVGDNLLELSERDTDGAFLVKTIMGLDKNPLGTKYGALLQRYAVCKTELEAAKKGWLTTRKYVGAKVQVQITGL